MRNPVQTQKNKTPLLWRSFEHFQLKARPSRGVSILTLSRDLPDVFATSQRQKSSGKSLDRH
jgi:hypothetical protein